MKNFAFWLKLSVFNFMLVALLGCLMRYKIAYSLPILEQKHVLEAHSHFAFYGWITQCIYTFLTDYIAKNSPGVRLRKYYISLIVNAIAAYSMIPLFVWKGYFAGSIAASTLALSVSFCFFIFALLDLQKVKTLPKPWFLAGLFFAVISSAGVFSLAYMMVTKHVDQNVYLASEYYYLHFQYNGFFIFSCIGLLIDSLQKVGGEIGERFNKMTFWLMFVGCLIGYGLSVLWAKLPMPVFVIIVLGTVAQTVGAFNIFKMVKTNWAKLVPVWSPLQRFALMYVGLAFFVKIMLQLGSNIPDVNRFAFGFRNIVIAYLHLVLLMCIAVFLVSQILATNVFQINERLKNGFKLLMTGIFLNELILGLMGVFSIFYIALPGSPVLLLAVSLLMWVSLIIIFISLRRRV